MSLSDLSKNFHFEFDHVGIAVKSVDEKSIYDSLGVQLGSIEVVESERVRVKMFEMQNNCRVELLEPLSKDSVIQKFLDKRGQGIHHICLRVKDIREVLARLEVQNVKLIHREPIKGAHNCEVAFIHPSACGGVLIELSEKVLGK